MRWPRLPIAATPGRWLSCWQRRQGGRSRGAAGGDAWPPIMAQGTNRREETGDKKFFSGLRRNRERDVIPVSGAGMGQKIPLWVGVGVGARDAVSVTVFSHEVKKKRHKRHSDHQALTDQDFQNDTTSPPVVSCPSSFQAIQRKAAAAMTARREWLMREARRERRYYTV
jgi:hypothetical protein